MLGDKISTPTLRTRLYNHDAEDKQNLVVIGETDTGEVIELSRRAAEATSSST